MKNAERKTPSAEPDKRKGGPEGPPSCFVLSDDYLAAALAEPEAAAAEPEAAAAEPEAAADADWLAAEAEVLAAEADLLAAEAEVLAAEAEAEPEAAAELLPDAQPTITPPTRANETISAMIFFIISFSLSLWFTSISLFPSHLRGSNGA